MKNNISHRFILQLMICLIFCSCAWCVENDGLVGYWDFDEGTGVLVHDNSGNGNDGTISGAVFVDSPRGNALSFDGVNNYVDFGSDLSMNLNGDMTLEVWIKYKYDGSKKSQSLIFGDSAGGAVFRNFNIRIEEGKNILRFEWANSTTDTALLTDASFLDGIWRHIAVVCEYPNCFIFVDGKEVNRGIMPFPIASTQGGPRYAGGWAPGYLKADLDEIRLYSRALSAREISENAGLPIVTLPIKTALKAYAVYSKGTLTSVRADIMCTNAPADPSVHLELLKMGSAISSKVADAKLKETRSGSERYALQFDFPPAGLDGGEYQIKTTISDTSGTIVDTLTSDKFSIDSQAAKGVKPAWFESKVGVSDKVLSPYTPIKVLKDSRHYVVNTWGRSYVFTSAPFMERIKSKDAELLCAPVRISCTIDGAPVIFKPGMPRLVQSSQAKVVLRQVCPSGKADLIIDSSIEYDGFIRVDWRIKARKPVSVDNLRLEYPLDARYAKYLYNYPFNYSGSLPNKYESEFKPIFWIGDEDRGLSWVAESDQYWNAADPKKAIQISKGDKEVSFSLKMVDKSIKLKAGASLSYAFGLQATPVRPMNVDVWDYRIADLATWYGYEMSVPEKMVGDVPALKYYADKGARNLMIWRWTDVFSYIRPIGHEEEFSKAVKAYHDYGLKVIVYYAGSLLSDAAPEWQIWKDDMLAKPDYKFEYSGPLLPGLKLQTCYLACSKGSWQDFVVDSLARLIDQYDVDGIYLDGTTIPMPCTNQAHGCGYRRLEGTIAPTYNVFGARELTKRLYTVVKQRKPDGVVEAHTGFCVYIPAISFATSYWHGEWINHLPSMETFRTEFMGRNFGVPADLLYNTIGDYSGSTAQALLHDVPTCPSNVRDLDMISTIWRVRDEFGCKQAEFLPYWSNSKYASASPEDCYVSLYRHKTNGVLAVVANLTKSEANTKVKLDLPKLGISGQFKAIDAVSKQPIDIGAGNLVLTMPASSWRMIWIRSSN